MSEQQVTALTPSDSVSGQGGKTTRRARPGKAQRQAARENNPSVASATTGYSSMSNAQVFSRQATYDPVPQPGKYPVVFPSGAGEPTKDVLFTLDPFVIRSSIAEIPDNYLGSARFAEFSSNAEYSDDAFRKDVSRFTLLAIAQQIVHAHVNMGLPMGDFSSIASTDVHMMSSIRSIVSQFGEFSVENLGNRYLLADYESTVKSLVIAADKISQPTTGVSHIPFWISSMWLPTRAGDPKTAFYLASKVQSYLEGYGATIPHEVLRSTLFVEQPPGYTAIKTLLPESERDVLDPLFTGYTTTVEFVSKFTGSDAGNSVRALLGIPWASPNRAHLDWDLVPKTKFPLLVDAWLKKRATIQKFFLCSSSLSERTNAMGSPAQLSTVSTVAGVSVVRTRVALSAPEFSLLACFPASGLSEEQDAMNVVLTTSVPLKVRATEFMQRDWLG